MLKRFIFFPFFVFFQVFYGFSDEPEESPYRWLSVYNIKESIYYRILPPEGFKRTEEEVGSFGFWLRFLPLKLGNPPVFLYNGKEKNRQDVHYAVLDIDTGKRDLQQCADALIRLRAEYLWYKGLYNEIHFNFLSGFNSSYEKWRDGFRPVIKGNKVYEEKIENFNGSYKNFKDYLKNVFMYANTTSLSLEMEKVELKDMKIGDVFICRGKRGGICHSVIILDMVSNNKGEKKFLLAQSYIPAQDIHILKNPVSNDPWYDLNFGEKLVTPEWTFSKEDLKRFK